MKYVLFLVIGYIVMYAAIWLHEIGHSLFDYRFGAKDNWLKVQVKPYIFFSTPGPIDADVWRSWKDYQHVLSAYGGIFANALWALVTAIIIAVLPVNNIYLSMALWLFMTLHIGEIVSYLFIGSIYLVSDMKIVAEHMPRLRLPNIAVGLVATVLYVLLLTRVPAEFRTFIIIWNVISVLSMCMGRIIFSVKAAHAQ